MASTKNTFIIFINRVDKDAEEFATLPDGWMKCDGSIIDKGPWKSFYTPNLNGEERFLRGG